MTILDRDCIFGTSIHLQLERWDEIEPVQLKIAVYPVVKEKLPEYPYQKVGDTFRIVLSRNFKDDDELKTLYRRIKNGRIPLGNCLKHFQSEREAKLVGIL